MQNFLHATNIDIAKANNVVLLEVENSALSAIKLDLLFCSVRVLDTYVSHFVICERLHGALCMRDIEVEALITHCITNIVDFLK